MKKFGIKDVKKFRKVLGLSIALTTASMTCGCGDKVVIEDQTEIYDYIDSNDGDIRIKPQVLEVPGEDFNLVVEYSLDEDTSKKWKITANKEIFTKTYTKGLPDDTKVWIDNIHTDISIVSSYECMDGITQDSLDDRIHNSLMYGFPISDNVCHYANSKIQGQNKDFIEGSYWGFEGYGSGEIKQKRYEESDYLSKGVYANLITSSYGLLIQKGDNEPYGVDVPSNILILINNEITKTDDSGEKTTYIYDRYGNCEEKEKSNAKALIK